MSPSDPEAEAAEQRARARATWEVRVYRGGAAREQAEADDRAWWLALSPDDRANLVWELSREQYGYDPNEPRLPRSARVARRR